MHALGVIESITLREYARAKMKDLSNARKKKWFNIYYIKIYWTI